MQSVFSQSETLLCYPTFTVAWFPEYRSMPNVWTRMGISAVEVICVFVVKMRPPGHELSPQFLRFLFSKRRHED